MRDPNQILHGTFNAYTNQGCRCDRCKRANREYERYRRSGPHTLTREEAKHCQCCGVRLSEHPLVACWRLLR